MHSVLPLKGWDEAVDLRDREGVAANKKWMKAKNLAQLVVLKMTASHAVNGCPGLHAHHGGHGRNQVHQAYKRCRAELFVAKF